MNSVTIESVKTEIDSLLTTFCDSQIKNASLQSKEYQKLWENVKLVATSGGKRLRPYLLLCAYELFGGEDHQVMLPAACAQELLHISMLVHDDIIDRDEERHGKPNITGLYKRHYEDSASNLNLDHYSMAAALLAGDILISSANTIVLQSNLIDTDKLTVLELLQSSVFTVVGGELSDVESTFMSVDTIDPLHIAHFKTAIYSFVNPLICGAKLAKCTQSNIQHLHDYGVNLGIAFQLTDDLLGVFGDELKTGKSVLSDLQEGKGTYLIQQTRALVSNEQSAEFVRYFGDTTLNASSAEKLRTIIVDCGAKAATAAVIDEHIKKARKSLSELSEEGFDTHKLNTLLLKATQRDV